LCYFKALQSGHVNVVVPIDKSSTVLAMLFAMMFLGEPVTLLKTVSMAAIGVGTYMMIQKQEEAEKAAANYKLYHEPDITNREAVYSCDLGFNFF